MTGEKISINVATIPVEDGEMITINKIKFKVIKTPFHTEGSVCYLFEDDNALFTGDTLFKGSIGRTDLATSDPSKINSSLMKLNDLSEWLVVYPGHGGISRLGQEKETNPYFVQALKQ